MADKKKWIYTLANGIYVKTKSTFRIWTLLTEPIFRIDDRYANRKCFNAIF